MKTRKILVLLLSGVIGLTACSYLSGCRKNKATNLNISYIKDLAIDVNGLTGFAIKSEEEVGTHKNSVQLASYNTSGQTYKVTADEQESGLARNYLYATKADCEQGDFVYSPDSVEKVSFKKNDSVKEEIYDSDGKVISSERRLTQEEIPAQINKFYATENFLFMQFVFVRQAKANDMLMIDDRSGHYYFRDSFNAQDYYSYTEVRPDDLVYDENGITEFDRTGYRNSEYVKNFVVDRSTGYIYQIENFNIDGVVNTNIVGVNTISVGLDGTESFRYYYRISVNPEGELLFTDVMPNREVCVEGVETDKYGYTFVWNDAINLIDKENKMYYFTNVDEYFIDDAQEVYQIDTNYPYTIKSVMVNGEPQKYNNDKVLSGLRWIGNSSGGDFIGNYKGNPVWGSAGIYSAAGREIIYNLLTFSAGDSGAIEIKWLGNNFLTSTLLYCDDDGGLYYKIIDIESCIESPVNLTPSDFQKIWDGGKLEDVEFYDMKVGKSVVRVKDAFTAKTPTGTKCYKAVKNGDKVELKLLQDKEYTQNVFIFQPLSK